MNTTIKQEWQAMYSGNGKRCTVGMARVYDRYRWKTKAGMADGVVKEG